MSQIKQIEKLDSKSQIFDRSDSKFKVVYSSSALHFYLIYINL